jgi:hypothetical protein
MQTQTITIPLDPDMAKSEGLSIDSDQVASLTERKIDLHRGLHTPKEERAMSMGPDCSIHRRRDSRLEASVRPPRG